MELKPAQWYARELRPSLPSIAFTPARSRVLWLPVNATIVAALAWSMATGRLPWPLWPVASIVIGVCLAGLTFLGHETLHGGVSARQDRDPKIVGWFGFMPFVVSPQLWVVPGTTASITTTARTRGSIPTCIRRSRSIRRNAAPGSWPDYFGISRKRLTEPAQPLFFGYTGQSQQMLWKARKTGMLTPKLHRRAIFETMLGVAFWIAVAIVVGFVPFPLFVYVLPLVIANSVRHDLHHDESQPVAADADQRSGSSPRSASRCRASSSGSRSTSGYHVEHHVFPTLSTRHGAAMREQLIAHFPGRYSDDAADERTGAALPDRASVKDDVTLIDPPSGEEPGRR